MLQIGGQKVPTKILLLLVSDALLIVLGLLMAVALRFQTAPAIAGHLQRPDTLPRFVVVVLVCGLALYLSDLYDFRVVERRSEIFVRLLQALGLACFALATTYYLAPDLSLGRGVAAIAAPLILGLTLGWRVLVEEAGWMLGGSDRVLIVGTGATGIALAREMVHRPELNMKVVGFLDERGENIGKSLVNPGIIGAAGDVEEIVEQQKINRVVLSLAERRGQTPVRQLLHLKFAGVGVEDAHTFYERLTGRILLEHLSPSWLILSDGFKKSRLLVLTKRGLDIAASLLVLIFTWPILLVVALAIRLEDGAPVLYRQERSGMGGRPFDILKFRSMRHDSEGSVPKWTADGDSRITWVGHIIRKYRIDELPQLFNVLRGEMSFVGPRPERPYFCRLLEEKIPFYALRHSVRPGITGWAQIKYQYGASIEEAKTKLEYDLFYIKHLSIFLDFAILFETAKVILLRRGAK